MSLTQSILQRSRSNFPPVTAFVLAGGKSSRMGQDKALLKYKGELLIHYPLRLLQKITPDVRILGDPVKYAFLRFPVIPDLGESKGPLTGIYTALRSSPTLFNLILACDMPLMQPEFFELLLEKAPHADAAVMRFEDGSLDPLCSLYSATCLRAIEANFEKEKYKISDFFKEINVAFLSEVEIFDRGLSRKIFTNVNTQEELERLSS